jgi:hypothetical protein
VRPLTRRAAEPQPTSSRWRALTHAHIRALFAGLEAHATAELAETALRWAADVFAVAGCAPNTALPLLRARAGPQLAHLARAALALVRVAREEIMSTAFDVAAVPPGRAFDGAEMSDAFADAARAREGAYVPPPPGPDARVLCTTEIGLACATRRAPEPREDGEGGDGGEEAGEEGPVIQRMLLLKPKVVLESVTRALEG